MSTSRLNKQTCDFEYAHSLTSMQQSVLSVVTTSAQSPNSLSCQKPTPYKVRVVFSKPVHAVRARGGLPGLNHGPIKAKPSSHNVHSVLQMTTPTATPTIPFYTHFPLLHPFW